MAKEETTQKEQTQVVPADTNTAVATPEPQKIGGYPIAEFKPPETPELSEEVKADLAEDMEGLTAQFDRVKIPSAGGIAWELPGDNSDVSKEIVGVIIDHHACNAYYKGKYVGGNEPPDCSSMDTVTGYDRQGKSYSCAACEFNQFGSEQRDDGKEGKGKACKNMRRVYLLQGSSDDAFPWLITIPPTSLKNFSNFMVKRVVSRGLRSFDVVIKLTLNKAESTDKITYSQVNFAVVGAIDPDMREGMKAYSQSIRALTRALKLTTADYAATGEHSSEDQDSGYTDSGGAETQTTTQKVYTGKAEVLPEEPII